MSGTTTLVKVESEAWHIQQFRGITAHLGIEGRDEERVEKLRRMPVQEFYERSTPHGTRLFAHEDW